MTVDAPERLESSAPPQRVEFSIDATPNKHGIGRKIAACGVAALALIGASEGLHSVFPSLPAIHNILPDGGQPDPAATGVLNYAGQDAKTATTKLVYPLGHGTALVEVKARQNWDRHGTFWDGDWVPTNGTASVSDAEDRDKPATLHVKTTYCAEGTLDRTTTPNTSTGVADVKYAFNVGEIMVCEANLLHTLHNDEQFHADNTPADFQSRFNNFIARAAETQVKAAPCPTDELEHYTSKRYGRMIRQSISDHEGVKVKDVKVVPGVIGESTPAIKSSLENKLKSFTVIKDRKNQDNKYKAVDIQYISGTGAAVKDACFAPIPEVQIGEVGQYTKSPLAQAATASK